MEVNLKQLLHTIYLKHPPNLFDEFIKECESFYTKPAHTLAELRVRNNKKIRGDLFEEFCVLYLKYVKGYDTVWLLEEVPNDILYSLSMKRQDMGIDLVVSRSDGFYAVQCKYKKKEKRKTSVSWSALSTFYALCLRTGPWQKYIVMTTADYTRHQGPKTEKDVSICIGSLRGIKQDDWLKMCQMDKTSSEDIIISTRLTDDEIRAKRLSYFTVQISPPQVEPKAP
jgi:predicted helicase